MPPNVAVVTGAAGFLGSRLCAQLLDEGQAVLGIDNFDPFYGRALKERNLASIPRGERFRFVEGDLLDLDLEPLLPAGCRIFHLAGQPGVSGSWGGQFDRYARNNVLATQRLLEVARRQDPSLLLYGGSSSVYGDQPEGPMSELARPNPISPYGVTKLAGEHLWNLYGQAYGLPVIALRFFSVYGPGQRPDMVFHRFIKAAAARQPIVIHGDGGQSRDFTYVDDLLRGVREAANSRAFGRTFNLGGGSPTPLRDVLAVLERISGGKLALRSGPLPPGDPRSTWADIREAKSAFDFAPQVRLEEGLQQQWDWQVAHRPHVPP